MKRILVVDDSEFIRDLHREILESAGFEVVEAPNGKEALEQYKTQKPDAVLLDLLMPDMDGMDVAGKSWGTDPEAVAFICSTDKQKYRRKEAAEIGCKAFLPKPLDGEILIETLDQFIGDK